METQTNLKLLLVAVASLSLMACRGGGAAGSTDLESRNPTNQDTNQAWVQCNIASSSGNGFEIHLAAVVENGNLRNDLMYLRFGKMPSDFTTASIYFQFYRWQANSSGSTYLDPVPLNFEIWDPQTGSQVLGTRASLRWSDVSTAASQMGISDAYSFFRRVMIKADLRDPNANFDALMTVLYNTSNAERERSNALLPVFAANPSAYATDLDGSPRNSALMNLHPFASSVGQGWTTADYQSRANTFCSNF